MTAPWEDDLPRPRVVPTIEETLEASQQLDKFLTAAIDSGLHEPPVEEKRSVSVSNKLMSFVDEVEGGLKGLEDHVDELMPRFRKAMEKGKEHMTKFQGHVERAEAAVNKVEEFNRRADGANS